MFEHGHSFDEIRAMNMQDFGYVLAVWREKSRIEAKKARTTKRKNFRG
jgi:hypothetical protein